MVCCDMISYYRGLMIYEKMWDTFYLGRKTQVLSRPLFAGCPPFWPNLSLRVARMAFMMDKITMGQDFLLEILLSPIRYLLKNALYSASYGAGNIDPSGTAVWGPCYISHYKFFICCMGVPFYVKLYTKLHAVNMYNRFFKHTK